MGIYVDPYWRQKAEAEQKRKAEEAAREAQIKAQQESARQAAADAAARQQAQNEAAAGARRAAAQTAMTGGSYRVDDQGGTSYAGGPGGGGGAGSGSGGSGGSGGGSVGPDDWRARLELQARLQAEAEARRWALIQQAQGSLANQAPIQVPDYSAHNAAAFARAKDMVGLQQRAALNSLRDYYSGGNVGGLRAAGEASLGSGLDQLGEVTRDQAMSDVERAAETARLNYEGGIQQRGQNMQYLQSLLGLFGGPAY